MSKSNPFSSFADAAEQKKVVPPQIFEAPDSISFTLREFIHTLKEIVKKDPSSLDTTVFFAEFGALVPSTTIEYSQGRIIIS